MSNYNFLHTCRYRTILMLTAPHRHMRFTRRTVSDEPLKCLLQAANLYLFAGLLVLLTMSITGCISELGPSNQLSQPQSLTEKELEGSSGEPPVWLFFEQQVDYLQTVYRLRLGGSTVAEPLLTIDLRKPENYYLSPDGRHAVLRADGILRVVDLISNQEVTRLESGPRLSMHFTTVEIDNDVVWSPKSDKFVFLVETWYLRTDIMMYDLNTGNLSQLTDNPSRINAPTWSPDGEQLAFAVWESCGESLGYCSSKENYWNIAIINSDGSNYRLITDMTDFFLAANDWTINSLCRLQWSPDKAYIVFKSYCPAMTISTHDEIFVVKTDGSQTSQLTKFRHIDYSLAYSTVWSPDSNYLAIGYTRDYIFDDLLDSSGFLIFDADSFAKDPIKIEVKGVSAYSLSWSPDRKYVIASLGPEHSFVGQFQGDQLTVITDALPRVSSAGYWAADGYVTQSQNRLIKVMLPSGEISELGIELEDGMTLIGWRQVDVPFK
jgi:Tol biopolymer transport system component